MFLGVELLCSRVGAGSKEGCVEDGGGKECAYGGQNAGEGGRLGGEDNWGRRRLEGCDGCSRFKMEEGPSTKRYVDGIRLRRRRDIGVRVRVTSDPAWGMQAAYVCRSAPVWALHLFLDSVGDQAVGLRAKLGTPQEEVTGAGKASSSTGANV